MAREIKLKYIWSNPTKTHFLSEIFTLDEIESGEQFMVLDNEPFFKNYRRVAILQWTGLLDKNGKEIYEGDILKHIPTFEANYFVKNLTGGFYLCPNNKDYGEYFASLFAGYDNKNQCNSIEIIGNIYEHKYLLDNK